ncbi:Protein of uncharacterised function (DUF2762) [Clostridioides difficile]|nr:Protein of uncharacterised function (DUF2762) [Clostridioides difficile]
MFDQLIKIATTQGVWTMLGCVLIVYILKAQENRDLRQEEREKNYQDIIKQIILIIFLLYLMDIIIKKLNLMKLNI